MQYNITNFKPTVQCQPCLISSTLDMRNSLNRIWSEQEPALITTFTEAPFRKVNRPKLIFLLQSWKYGLDKSLNKQYQEEGNFDCSDLLHINFNSVYQRGQQLLQKRRNDGYFNNSNKPSALGRNFKAFLISLELAYV